MTFLYRRNVSEGAKGPIEYEFTKRVVVFLKKVTQCGQSLHWIKEDMKLKRVLQNSAVLVVSCFIALLFVEVGSRLVINPADYLAVTTVPDEIVGRVVEAKSTGFDGWGFRNKAVPSQVDIAAIGDSHTFGNTATMTDSWPMVLGRLSGLNVYNLGMGGYGPNQYYHLLKTRALTLKPRLVLCGLYMGDDFENAFSITYGLDYWSFLRKGNWGEVNADIWNVGNPRKGFLKGLRNWLAKKSILYQLTFHGPILGKVKGYLEVNELWRYDEFTSYLIVDEKNIREAFLPKSLLSRLDQKSSAVREGMRITFRLLKEMNEMCLQNGCRFAVVVIPTKEMVFEEYLENNPKVNLGRVINELLMNERSAQKELFEFLRKSGIEYVDTLPTLKREAGNQLYARTDKDMHPGRNGYRVIAEAIYRSLKENGVVN